ncbi:MAG: PIN domain-containing protein [Gracilimonas sp.]
MAKTVYIDAGPIVAILSKRDEHHHWATEKISEIEVDLVTTTIIITEAFHILKKVPNGIAGLFKIIEEGFIKVEESYPKNIDFIHQGVLKYQNIEASIGDLSLLSVLDESAQSLVFTLDYDFHIYRDNKGNPLNLISPYNL